MRPYYEHDGIVIYNGDCREILPTLPKVDFCWTDPPYNVGMDYGGWNDRMAESEYLNFAREWVLLAVKASECLGVYTPQKYMAEYWGMLGPKFRQIVLSYSASGAIRYGYSNQFSSILTNAKPVTRIPNVWHNCQMPGLGFFFREHNYGHPGYTSEDITSRVFKAFTVEGQTVVEPFCGSGTTLAIARRLGRNAIGCDISERYCEIAARRVEAERLTLFEHVEAKTGDLFREVKL